LRFAKNKSKYFIFFAIIYWLLFPLLLLFAKRNYENSEIGEIIPEELHAIEARFKARRDHLNRACDRLDAVFF